MRVDFRRRDAKCLVEGLHAKLARRSVEHADFLRRLDGHAFRAFSRLGRREQHAFLQIDGRLALHVIWVSGHETYSVSHSHPHGARSMDGFTPRALAVAWKWWCDDPCVVAAIRNPIPFIAGGQVRCRVKAGSFRGLLLASKFLEFFRSACHTTDRL